MASPARYRIGSVVLETDPLALLADGRPVVLQAKPLALLNTLVAAQGRLVPREVLLAEVWPDVVVSEASLSQAVRKVRKALAAAGCAKGAVETRAGRGYRFTVPVVAEARVVARVGNLGADLGGMVGREAEQATLQDLVSAHRLVSLVGPGGIGKTTLARAVGRAVQPQMSGGVWWVAAETATTPSGLQAAVAEVLDVTLRGDGAEKLMGALAARGALVLILDNLEQVEEPGPLVLSWLEAAPELRVLVTSRRRLLVRPERVLELRPMAPEDAVSLFQARAGDDSDDADAVAALLARVDHVPLAVELLAA